MSAVSGLSRTHRVEAKHIFLKGAELMLDHASNVHYVHPSAPAGHDRWEGIDRKLHIARNQYPEWSDCSSSFSWLHWNIWVVHFGLQLDRINGEHWSAGFTGSIAQALRRGHAKRVHHPEDLQIGDALLWGPAPNYEHVAGAVGGGYCFSHGSEPGPFHSPVDYRGEPDLMVRFI